MRGPVLPPEERGGRYQAHGEQDDLLRRREACALRPDDPEDQRGQRSRAEEGPGDIHPVCIGIRTLGQHHAGHSEGREAEGEVEPENAAPAPQADQRAPDDGASCQRESGHCRPHTDGPVAAALVGVELTQHRQRAGLAGGSAQPHDGPAGDQHGGVRRERADD